MRTFWTLVAILVMLVAAVLIFDPSRRFLGTLGLRDPAPEEAATTEPKPARTESAQAQVPAAQADNEAVSEVAMAEAGLLAPPGQQLQIAESVEQPYWRRPASAEAPVVTYEIKARLDPVGKSLTATETLVFRNDSPDAIPDLRFHLYLNAFRDPDSSYYLEGIEGPPSEPEYYGGIEIQKAWINEVESTGSVLYPTGDDGHPSDRTQMALPLAAPLLPGQSVKVRFEFVSYLPRAFDRTGYEGDYFLVAQWFPKLGVWESRGMRGRTESGWNARHHHSMTEFYSNFGNYKVDLVVPKDYKVGATGRLTAKTSGPDGEHHRFEMERVHDFAFTASASFESFERTFRASEQITTAERESWARRLKVPASSLLLPDIQVRLLTHKSHLHLVDRHFKAVFEAIKAFGLALGPYPYSVLTLVDPPTDAIRTMGGMEYPTFITLGTQAYYGPDNLDLEDVTVHEFAHQYFQGMLASNETEEPWLDEGFTNFVTAKHLDRIYGTKPFYINWFDDLFFDLQFTRLLGFDNLSEIDKNRLSSFQSTASEPVSSPGWHYHNPMHYRTNAYTKPATMLAQLEAEVGEETMARILHTYFQEWAFRHPSGMDFIAVVNKVSGRELNGLFDELLYKSGTLDYSVTSVESYDLPNLAAAGGKSGYQTEKKRHIVRIGRAGTIAYPVDIRVSFEDGEKRLEHFDGKSSSKIFLYDRKPGVTRVEIDPEGKVLIDRNRSNNGYVVEHQRNDRRRWQVRILAFTQNFAQILAGGF